MPDGRLDVGERLRERFSLDMGDAAVKQRFASLAFVEFVGLDETGACRDRFRPRVVAGRLIITESRNGGDNESWGNER